jgi:hypothetical protein
LSIGRGALVLDADELARRIELLFAVVYPRRASRRTTAELVAAMNRTAGAEVVAEVVVDGMRRGHPESTGVDAVARDSIARFFGVPRAYLSGDIAAQPIEAQLGVLASIREWDELRLSFLLSAVADVITDSMITYTDGALASAPGPPVCLRLVRTWQPGEDELNTGRGSDPKLWRRCQALVRELEKSVGLPIPMAAFLDRLADHRGRPIELRAFNHSEVPDGICGLWIDRADRDIIGFPTEARHGMHIVMHEIGHMLACHRGRAAVGAPQLTQFMPDLDPAMVQAVLGRSVYSEVEEREAELIASLIMDRVAGTVRPADASADLDSIDQRLQRTFGG